MSVIESGKTKIDYSKAHLRTLTDEQLYQTRNDVYVKQDGNVRRLSFSGPGSIFAVSGVVLKKTTSVDASIAGRVGTWMLIGAGVVSAALATKEVVSYGVNGLRVRRIEKVLK